MGKFNLTGIIVLVAAVAVGYTVTPLPTYPSLEGAWRITEASWTSPDTSWVNASPQPGLFLFLGRHYSTVFVQGSQPREFFSEETTDAERLAAYTDFIANAGTYEASGSTLSVRPLVAKVPNAMAGESFTYEYELGGDTLWLSLSAAWAQGGETVYTLVRVE